jgi:hypothetical protein
LKSFAGHLFSLGFGDSVYSIPLVISAAAFLCFSLGSKHTYSKVADTDGHVDLDAADLSLSSPTSSTTAAAALGKKRLFAVLNLVLLTCLAVLRWQDSGINYEWTQVDTRGNDKWIVVTTINDPSSSTMQALCALPDWEVGFLLLLF